jgi:uncharacterized protein YjbI with pentapeptide repeats
MYLQGADLGGADLGGTDLGGADLGGADLGGADLGGRLRNRGFRTYLVFSLRHERSQQVNRNREYGCGRLLR